MLLVAAPSLRAAPQADGNAVEADWILDRLARPAPMRTGSSRRKAPLKDSSVVENASSERSARPAVAGANASRTEPMT